MRGGSVYMGRETHATRIKAFRLGQDLPETEEEGTETPEILTGKSCARILSILSKVCVWSGHPRARALVATRAALALRPRRHSLTLAATFYARFAASRELSGFPGFRLPGLKFFGGPSSVEAGSLNDSRAASAELGPPLWLRLFAAQSPAGATSWRSADRPGARRDRCASGASRPIPRASLRRRCRAASRPRGSRR